MEGDGKPKKKRSQEMSSAKNMGPEKNGGGAS